MSFEKYVAYDIQTDEFGDLLIENGDLVLGPSDDAHVSSILFL